MGMYNWVTCDLPLPDGWRPNNGWMAFQTKTIGELLLDHYWIDSNGVLLFQKSMWPESSNYIPEWNYCMHTTKFVFGTYEDDTGKDINDDDFEFIWHTYVCHVERGVAVKLEVLEKSWYQMGEYHIQFPNGFVFKWSDYINE